MVDELPPERGTTKQRGRNNADNTACIIVGIFSTTPRVRGRCSRQGRVLFEYVRKPNRARSPVNPFRDDHDRYFIRGDKWLKKKSTTQ